MHILLVESHRIFARRPIKTETELFMNGPRTGPRAKPKRPLPLWFKGRKAVLETFWFKSPRACFLFLNNFSLNCSSIML